MSGLGVALADRAGPADGDSAGQQSGLGGVL